MLKNNIKFLLACTLYLVFGTLYSYASPRDIAGADTARVAVSGAMRPAATRGPIAVPTPVAAEVLPPPPPPIQDSKPEPEPEVPVVNRNCREAYEECMDLFCLFDEHEGDRCMCDDQINAKRTRIQAIENRQKEAERLFTEGVERERLGAQAELVFAATAVFGQSTRANRSRERVDLTMWLQQGGSAGGMEVGEALYRMAHDNCRVELELCTNPGDRQREELLYRQRIGRDCRTFNTFLNNQQRLADQNFAAAERAVRGARHAELGTTNRFNRGECLLAMRACVAEKGGCGDHFENCLTESLLTRRTHACTNITDQCMAVRTYVMTDWEEEMVEILAHATRFADRYRRQTCLSRIEACLEDHCAVGTNDQCLNDVNVAAGICPEINECNDMIPGIRDVVNNRLAFIRLRFCQNDIDACLRNACGPDFGGPQCVGRTTAEIAALCPQNRYPSCVGQAEGFNSIISSILLQVDFALMQGCINQFAETVARVCGADMTCVPENPAITTARTTAELRRLMQIPDNRNRNIRVTANNATAQVAPWRQFAITETDRIFSEIEQDAIIGLCAAPANPRLRNAPGRAPLGPSIFNTARMIGRIQAEDRQYRLLVARLAELARQEGEEAAREACEALASGPNVESATFEPALRNCLVCRYQEVCETGGQGRGAGAAQGAAGMAAAGASAGTMIVPGWGTAIGAAAGLVGGGIMGALASGRETFCQEIRTCEDVNMM